MNLSMANWPPPLLKAVKGKPIGERIPTFVEEFCAKSLAKIYQRKKQVHEQNDRPFRARTRASIARCPMDEESAPSCTNSIVTRKHRRNFPDGRILKRKTALDAESSYI